MAWESWHVHTEEAPYCRAWVESPSFYYAQDTARAFAKRKGLPQEAVAGPFWCAKPSGETTEYRDCPHRLKREMEEAPADDKQPDGTENNLPGCKIPNCGACAQLRA